MPFQIRRAWSYSGSAGSVTVPVMSARSAPAASPAVGVKVMVWGFL